MPSIITGHHNIQRDCKGFHLLDTLFCLSRVTQTNYLETFRMQVAFIQADDLWVIVNSKNNPVVILSFQLRLCRNRDREIERAAFSRGAGYTDLAIVHLY